MEMENIYNILLKNSIDKYILNFYGSPLFLFLFMFFFIYLFGHFKFFKNWDPKHRVEAPSCLISLAHGTPAVILSIFSILQHSNSQLPTFTSPNTKFQNLVLEYSIAYFVMDLLHYIIFFPSDFLFIAHHLATLYVFATCRFVVCYGSVPILVLLVLAEVTSPCQNTWSLARYRKSDSSTAGKLYDLLSPIFYGFYTVVRGILGPLFVFRMCVFYASGAADGMIPRWAWMAWISWICVIVTAIVVSILWSTSRWIEFYEDHQKMNKKSREVIQ